METQLQESRIRLNSPLTRVTVALIGAPIVIWAISPGKRAIVKKIMWHNRTGAAGWLTFGHLTLAAVFIPDLPDINMVNATDDELDENQLPIFGNTPEGFYPDITPLVGTLGNIVIQSTVGGAVPADVAVRIEVEEI